MKHSKTTDTACAGQDFDVFQAEDGLAEEVEARAIKTEVVALLAKLDMTQVQLAQKVQTSRTHVRRLLDPDNTAHVVHVAMRCRRCGASVGAGI